MLGAVSSPRELGFAMPPEWAPQQAVWMSWPTGDPRHWSGGDRARVLDAFAELAAAISRHATVRINVNPGQVEVVEARCRAAGVSDGRLECFEHPHDDVWCRDHGPIFLRHAESGELAVGDWSFNAWGGKFPPWDQDDAVPARIAEALGLRRFALPMVLEGGAIEVNGVGDLLTTEAVLLNPNRNPELDRTEVERRLRDGLGVARVWWLAEGIAGDDTDGHVDDLARFVAEDTILACREPDADSPNHAVLERNFERLQSFRTIDGRPFELVEIALPDPCEAPGWRLPLLPASYANFLVVNDGVLVPTFRQPRRDQQALGLIGELFPDAEVSGIDCLELLREGGAVHCLTRQQPAG